MNVVIRQAEERDWEHIRDINETSFVANKSFDPYLDMNWVYTEKAKKYFFTAITDPQYHVLIAELDGRPVGYLILGPKQYDYRIVRMIEVQNMAVLSEYRSKGIGSMLIREAKKWAEQKGFQTLYVNAYIQNHRAVEFYKKMGFEPIDMSLEMTLT